MLDKSRGSGKLARWNPPEREKLWRIRNEHRELSWPQFHQLNYFPERTQHSLYHEFTRMEKEDRQRRMNNNKDKRVPPLQAQKAKRSTQFPTAEARVPKQPRLERKPVSSGSDSDEGEILDVQYGGELSPSISPRRPQGQGTHPTQNNPPKNVNPQEIPRSQQTGIPAGNQSGNPSRSPVNPLLTAPRLVSGSDGTSQPLLPAQNSQPPPAKSNLPQTGIQPTPDSLPRGSSRGSSRTTPSAIAGQGSTSNQENCTTSIAVPGRSRSPIQVGSHGTNQPMVSAVSTHDVRVVQQSPSPVAMSTQDNPNPLLKDQKDPAQLSKEPPAFPFEYFRWWEQKQKEREELINKQADEIIQLEEQIKEREELTNKQADEIIQLREQIKELEQEREMKTSVIETVFKVLAPLKKG